MGVGLGSSFLLGGGSVAASVVQAQESKRAQKRAAREQEAAQRMATSRAAAELRQQSREQRRLNRRTPDLGAIAGRSREAGARGVGSTVLSGASGAGGSRPTLGSASSLGDV